MMGCGLALLGWQAAGHFRASSLEQLVFEDRPRNGQWTAALLFRPNECPSRMELVDRLNRLKTAGVTVQGLMIIDTLAFAGWRDLIIANRISFPVRPISPARASSALARLEGLPGPVFVVFDQERRLRVATDFASEAALAALPGRIASEKRISTPSTEKIR
jgi:hypothetical protein